MSNSCRDRALSTSKAEDMARTLPRLTIFGRSLILMVCEVAANVICWIVAGILFGKNSDTRPTLSLALLAWDFDMHWMQIISVTCLWPKLAFSDSRHAANQLSPIPTSAIDNATRCLINIDQLPVTCGLFFSLGHSTIVIVVTVAIAISSSVYDRIHGVGEVGGIIGAAVSGSFMFIIGLANSIILWKIIKRRRENKLREQRREKGELNVQDINPPPHENHMLMMRILGPIINFVDRPWKMYPVGVLFGLGFDTASSIALLAVSALAKRSSDGQSIPNSHIVILPLLFTAGMTLIDSADSILMLHSYAGFPQRSFKILDWTPRVNKPKAYEEMSNEKVVIDLKVGDPEKNDGPQTPNTLHGIAELEKVEVQKTEMQQKLNAMSGLSIILTLMSIMVAFSISLITIMGLIGEQCTRCVVAAEADDGHGGGLAGRWWRGWAQASEQSGYIGIAIVGVFVLIVAVWYGGKWAAKKAKERKLKRNA